MVVILAAAAVVGLTEPAAAQQGTIELEPDPADRKQFGELAEGPYERLVMRSVMVIPGNGTVLDGPFGIVIARNVIREGRLRSQ